LTGYFLIVRTVAGKNALLTLLNIMFLLYIIQQKISGD
jgi:hypothetical protein